MEIVNSRHIYLQRDYDGADATFQALSKELYEVRDILDLEIKRQYPDGLPDPQIIRDYYPLESEWVAIYPHVYLELLTDAILDDMNRNLVQLTDQAIMNGNGYKAQSFQIEIDRDPGVEWMILIRWLDIGALTWLTLDEDPGPVYTKLETELPNLEWPTDEWDDNIEVLQDFTGDGLTDVIFRDRGYFFGTDFGTFHIAQGTTNGFQRLGAVSQSIPGYLSEGLLYDIRVPEDSRWLTLTISNPHSINWDCQWSTVSTYRWPYGQEQVTVTGENPPRTPDCNLAKAVSVDEPLDNKASIQLLESAITHFDKGDPKESAKIQFIHYRLALLYALEGQDFLARQHFQRFIDSYLPSSTFLRDKLLPLLDERPLSPIRLCSTLYSADPADIPEAWRDYATATAAFNAYPISYELYPPVICPLRRLLTEKLKAVRFDPRESPEAALVKAGISVTAIHSYPIPRQDHPAWFALLGTEAPLAAGFVGTSTGWGWQVMYQFDPSPHQPRTFYADATEDGYPELAFVLPSNAPWVCAEQEQGYELFLTTASKVGFVSIGRTVCVPKNEPLDIPIYLADENGDGLVDWVIEQLQGNTDVSVLSAERTDPLTWFSPSEIRAMLRGSDNANAEKRDYAKELYDGADPAQVRDALFKERGRIDPNGEFASQEWQHLTYLIAVSYEMEGQIDQAMDTYLAIMKAVPQTLWGNLASIHIKAAP